jgi:hypothetical protein
MGGARHNLLGKTFGQLTVVGYPVGKSKKGNYVWPCKCECGNNRDVEGAQLLYGGVTQCRECGKKAQQRNGVNQALRRRGRYLMATLPPSAMDELGLEDL